MSKEYPACIAEIDPSREAHHPIDICMMDGTRIASVSPKFADLAEEIARALDLILSARKGAA